MRILTIGTADTLQTPDQGRPSPTKELGLMRQFMWKLYGSGSALRERSVKVEIGVLLSKVAGVICDHENSSESCG